MCVLSGANVARPIALGQFSESTLGYENVELAKLFFQLFNRPYFRVSCVADLRGVELCGAMKNVVALAAGFADGLEMASNTKSALLRIGLSEMRAFAEMVFGAESIEEATYWDSCGVADLITTCLGGRNRRCAEVFARCNGEKSWEQIEKEELGGQKLQGTLTSADVYHVLEARDVQRRFPLFSTVYEIAHRGRSVTDILAAFMSDELTLDAGKYKPRRSGTNTRSKL